MSDAGNSPDNLGIADGEVASVALPPGFEASDTLKSEAFARILLLGAMKIGKSTVCLETAPGPVLNLNCDGIGASQFAAKRGARFGEALVTSIATWDTYTKAAAQAAADGNARTIIVDTVTLLADTILGELDMRNLDGFEKWNALEEKLKLGLRRLLAAPAHVIFIAHMDPRDDEIAGICPLIPGKVKVWLPSKVADWVLFNINEAGERHFVLGQHDRWKHGGRNVKKPTVVEAHVESLLEELGISP